jgi:hypothetical protein
MGWSQCHPVSQPLTTLKASELTFSSLSPKDASRWERRTWIALKKLVEETPEAGIHFQSKSS